MGLESLSVFSLVYPGNSMNMGLVQSGLTRLFDYGAWRLLSQQRVEVERVEWKSINR